MKKNEPTQRKQSPCSMKINPMPEFFTCTRCGFDVEIWTDEESTACDYCGHRIFKRETTVH